MGQVTITLNGRSYRLTCGDGEERRLLQLAAHVESKLTQLVAEFGQVGDDRLLVMASVLITDELFDARATLLDLRQQREAERIADVPRALPGEQPEVTPPPPPQPAASTPELAAESVVGARAAPSPEPPSPGALPSPRG